MDRQRQMMQQGIGDQAASAGAFGGSRHGVAEAETNRGFGDLFGNQMAAMRMAGFDNASGLMNQDLARQMQAQASNQGVDAQIAMLNPQLAQQAGLANMTAQNQMSQFDAGQQHLANLANQQAGLQGGQLNLQGGQLLGQLGQQQQQMGMNQGSALMNLGLGQQQFSQQQMDAIRNLPLEQQQIINEALGLYPGIGEQSSRQTQGLLGPVLGAAGMAMAGPLGAGMFGAAAPAAAAPALGGSFYNAASTLYR